MTLKLELARLLDTLLEILHKFYGICLILVPLNHSCITPNKIVLYPLCSLQKAAQLNGLKPWA